MRPRSRTRFALALVVFVLPLAAAQAGLPDDPTSAIGPPAPSATTPSLPGLQGPLDVHEDGLFFQGSPTAPSYVAAQAPDGTMAFEYVMHEDGRASLDLNGENAIADATLIEVRGAPTDDAFTLVLADARGDLHEVNVDRLLLEQDLALPPEAQLPAITVVQPPAWPRAPAQPYLLFVEDGEPNHHAAARLDGTPYMQLAGTHKAVLQVPADEQAFDRIFLQARDPTTGRALNATFEERVRTDNVTIYAASYSPAALGAADGHTLSLSPVYERRLSPLVAERFVETATYAYRLDGAGPTVSIVAPAKASGFSFDLSWSGVDARSGVASYNVDYRETTASSWIRWLVKSPATSATFSGDWEKTYVFRVAALDKVGNPSPFAEARTVVPAPPPGAQNDINDPPTARLLTPRAGSRAAGIVAITWTASDPDGTPVTSRVELSPDEGASWRVLYVGTGTRADWDTRSDVDGAGYRLRLTVSDGTQQASDAVGALSVANVVAAAKPAAAAPLPVPTPEVPPTPTAAPAQPAAPEEDARAEAPTPPPAEKGVPMPFVGGAIAVAALLARRR